MTLNEARKFAAVVTEVYVQASGDNRSGSTTELVSRIARDLNLHFPKFVWWTGVCSIEVTPRRRRKQDVSPTV